MRRAELLKMELEQKSSSFYETHVATSKFVQKFINIPVIKAAVGSAERAYVKVKDSNALVGKSLELALNISCVVAGKLSPLAEKGMVIAAPFSTKMDDIAAKSLDGLITRVPVIREQPQEIVQNTRSAIEKQVYVLNNYTEAALRSWPCQTAMDMYEVVLSTACNTLDNVLPSEKSSADGLSSQENYPAEEEKHKRGIWLANKTYIMFSTAFKRVFGISSHGEIPQEQPVVLFKPPVVEAAPPPAEPSNNGESHKPQQPKKQGKNKKNSQDQQ